MSNKKTDPFNRVVNNLRKVGETENYEVYDFGPGSSSHVSINKKTGEAHITVNEVNSQTVERFDMTDIQIENAFNDAAAQFGGKLFSNKSKK